MDRLRACSGQQGPERKTTALVRWAGRLTLAGTMAFGGASAHAVDGCAVLLCFAAPDWRAIAECVPPIRQVLRDLARGRPFPTCAMGGAGNSADHTWSSAPGYCPPQYTRVFDGPSGLIYSCDYVGAISVQVNGAAFARTWWNPAGDTVTEFSATAKAQLGSWDTRFDDDYAAWLAALPPPPPASTGP